MSVVANVAVNLDARQAKVNSDALNNKVQRLNRTINTTGRATSSAAASVRTLGVAFASILGPIASVAGAINLVNSSLKVLGDRQVDANLLANGLAKVGGTTNDLLKLQKVAQQLGRQTLFNREDFDRGFALLTSFQSIGVASYERVAKAAADVAQVTRQDVNSSLMQLAKALQDPVRGLSALSRSGTQFTQAQQDLIKSLVESGRQLEAQDIILKEIESQYGNAAEAAGSAGYAGAIDTLGESFRDFQERLGRQVQPAVQDMVEIMTRLFDIVNKIPEPVGKAESSIKDIALAFEFAASQLAPFINGLEQLQWFFRNLTPPGWAMQIIGGAAERGRGIISAAAEMQRQAQRDAFIGPRAPEMQGPAVPDRLRQAAGGPTAPTPAPTSGRGAAASAGRSGIDQALRDAQRAAELARQQVKAADDQNFALKNQLAIIKELDPARRRFVEYEVRQAEIAKQYNELKLQAKSTEELLLLNANNIIQERIAQIEYERDINEIIERRARLMLNLVRSAASPTVFNELEQQDAALQSVLDKYPAIGMAASAAAGMVTTSVGEMVSGTKKVQEAFADFLNGIGNALMQTAKQMIAQYIAIGIARIFAGIGSSSLPDFTPITNLTSVAPFNPVTTNFTGFAEGGFVTGPTRAMVGEGGEPEYVIPASKMQAAMSRYSRGARGEGVIPATGGSDGQGGGAQPQPGPIAIDVRYSVERINDVEYVTADQFREGMRKAAQQGATQGEQRALRQLQQNTTIRNRVGLR